ncbi:MAG: hypothetical protein AAF357_00560 [Verrucomicrobiota bacterium]
MKPVSIFLILITPFVLSPVEANVLSGYGPYGGGPFHQLPHRHHKKHAQRVLVEYHEVKRWGSRRSIKTRTKYVKLKDPAAVAPPTDFQATNAGKGIFRKLLGNPQKTIVVSSPNSRPQLIPTSSSASTASAERFEGDTMSTSRRKVSFFQVLFGSFSRGSHARTSSSHVRTMRKSPSLRPVSGSSAPIGDYQNDFGSAKVVGSPIYRFVQVASLEDLPYPTIYQSKVELPPVSPYRQYLETILPKDFLEIRFTDSAENSPFFRSFSDFRVGPLEVPNDGYIPIPYSRNINVLGKNITTLTREVSAVVQEVSPTAEVTINRVNRLAKRAFVIGEVSTSGSVLIDREEFTLVDAIAGASPTLPSHLNRFVLEREGTSVPMTALQLYRQRPLAQDGDVVRVERDTALSFFVLGAVEQPGRFDFPDMEPTLVEALSVGGGLVLSNANPEAVFVFRSEYGQDTVYGMDFSTPRGAFLAQKFVLGPNDIIYVSEAPLSKWQRVAEVVNSTSGPSLSIRNLTRTNRF